MSIKPVFGLDIGSFTLKVVQIKHHGGRKTLEAASIVDLSDKVDTLLEKNPRLLGEDIKKAISSSRPRPINTKFVVSALPESKVYSEIISMPKMEEEELKNALPFEAAKHMPMPLKESYLDYSIIKENAGSKNTKKALNFLAVAAPRRTVNQFYNLIQAIGLELVVLETKPIAAVRALIADDLLKETILIFDIGAKNSSLTVTSQGNVFLVTTSSSGGENFIQALKDELKITREKALQISGLADKNPETKEKILKILYPLFENTAQELQKAIKYYDSHNLSGGSISKILLAGGGSITPGLGEYLQEETKIKTIIANPFAKLEPGELINNILKFESSTLTTAVGLALKEVES